MESDIIVLYHANCPDGFGSAWSFWKKYGHAAKYIPVKHGEPPPDVLNKNVFILDFSYDRNTLLEMKKDAKSLVVIDHHISAKNTVGDLDFCLFDINHSGAYLAWKYLFGEDDVPNLILYIEDRDLWKWQMPNSNAILSSIDSYEKTFEKWDLLSQALSDLDSESFCLQKTQGEGMVRYKETLMRSLIKNAHTLNIAGHDVPAINSCFFQSEMGSSLCEGKPFAAVYYFDGREYKFSLRSSSEGEDVSKIASLFGGGGHRNASGFSTQSLDNLSLTKGSELNNE